MVASCIPSIGPILHSCLAMTISNLHYQTHVLLQLSVVSTAIGFAPQIIGGREGGRANVARRARV